MLGFDHESEMSPWAADPMRVWPGVLDGVPPELREFVEEPAFDSAQSTTFCLWRSKADEAWQCGEIDYPHGDADADGSSTLLKPYTEGAEGYVEFAKDYYEVTILVEAVARIFAFDPLHEDLVRMVNAATDWAAVQAEALAMGYPLA